MTETQHEASCYGYELDAEDRIIGVDEAWRQFAIQNGGADILDKVLNRPIYEFVTGEETRTFYRQVLAKVRATQLPLQLPFRCDAPSLRRYMRLEMIPSGEGRVTCRSRTTKVEPRPSVEITNSDTDKPSALAICSLCRRVAVSPTRWLELEDALNELELFDPRAPSLRQRVCPVCQDLESACSHLVTLPEGYDPTVRYPLVVFLHGAGQARWLFRLYAPPRISVRQGDYVLLSPLRVDQPRRLDQIETAIEDTLERYSIDPDRVYLTGISAGAALAWALLDRQPNRFAAFVPIAGRGYIDRVHKVKHVPVWAFHGEHDEIIPVSESEAIIGALKAAGGRARLTIYPNTGHDAWSRTYYDGLLWRWLLSQRRLSNVDGLTQSSDE